MSPQNHSRQQGTSGMSSQKKLRRGDQREEDLLPWTTRVACSRCRNWTRSASTTRADRRTHRTPRRATEAVVVPSPKHVQYRRPRRRLNSHARPPWPLPRLVRCSTHTPRALEPASAQICMGRISAREAQVDNGLGVTGQPSVFQEQCVCTEFI